MKMQIKDILPAVKNLKRVKLKNSVKKDVLNVYGSIYSKFNALIK